MKNLARRMAIAGATSLLSLSFAQAAYAQADGDAAQGPEATGQLDDIVVTAQRRSESAQNVPISLQSFSSDQLERTAVRSTEDLTSIVGGLIIQPSAARPAIYIRGIGTNSGNATPAILTFVDGVYYPFGQSMEFANIQSIEVLKGPQGTLFGRNATGGVLQITTRPPSETLGAKVNVGFANYNTVEASAYVTGGLGKGLAMDAAVSYRNQGDGFGTNVFNGDDAFFSNKFQARARLRAELSDSTHFTVAADYSEVEGMTGTGVAPSFGYPQIFAAGALRFRGPGQFYPGDFDINAGPRTPGFKANEWGVSGTFETEFSDMTFRSITAYRRGAEHIKIDFDGAPIEATNLTIDREPRTSLTQEFQLLSGSGSPFQWVAGVYYYKGTARMNSFDLNLVAISSRRQAFSYDSDESIAPYAQATYEVLPGTKVTLGGRYTWEKRTIDGFVRINGVVDPNRTGADSQTFKEFTWRAAIDHRFSPDAMIYASVSRGFNTGFFNQSSTNGFANRTQNPAVRPEFITAYEVGTKLDLLDRHLRVNLSGFLYNYKDLQQQIYDNSAVITVNAAAAQIKGIDFEFVARPTDALTLSLAGTYLDTKYKSYPAAPNYIVIGSGAQIGSINVDPAQPSTSAAGKTIVNAPQWSWTAAVSHVLQTGIGEFTTSANLNYRGRTYIDPLNRFKLPTRYVLDLTERWSHPDGHFFVTAWAKNLLDKHYDYAVNILTPVGLVSNPAPPRTYGVTLGFDF